MKGIWNFSDKTRCFNHIFGALKIEKRVLLLQPI